MAGAGGGGASRSGKVAPGPWLLTELLDALESLADEDLEDILEDIYPDELKDLCKYRWLIELLLSLCTRGK